MFDGSVSCECACGRDEGSTPGWKRCASRGTDGPVVSPHALDNQYVRNCERERQHRAMESRIAGKQLVPSSQPSHTARSITSLVPLKVPGNSSPCILGARLAHRLRGPRGSQAHRHLQGLKPSETLAPFSSNYGAPWLPPARVGHL